MTVSNVARAFLRRLTVAATRQTRFASRTAAKTRSEDANKATVPKADPASDSATARWIEKHAKYKVATYARPPIVLVRGQGLYVWDMEGRKYLDFTGGIAVNSLGHSDPELAKIMLDQANTLVHCSNLYHNPWADSLAELLVEKTRASGGMHDAAAAFLCNSGAEANEGAIKFGRKVGKALDPSGAKHEVVCFEHAFHGRTMGSLSATPNAKYQAPFAPLVPGFKVGRLNDVAGLRDLVTDRTCAVMVEPIQGEGGVRTATDDFLVALAHRCRDVGALLHHDEVQCGLGRTGSLWAHANLPREAHPDVVTTAKGIGNGFPLGAVLVNAKVADAIKVGDHGTTFGGNPLACRLAHHVVGRLASPTLLRDVTTKSAVLVGGLDKLRARYPDRVLEVRGKGLLIGLQLCGDPSPVVQAARERGLLVITGGINTLRFAPSLTILEDEIVDGLAVLDEAFRATMA